VHIMEVSMPGILSATGHIRRKADVSGNTSVVNVTTSFQIEITCIIIDPN